ncbi:hypothetical protein EYF80_043108 [Liparis tanakae]|uniref:Uncharacterized protein n=1 Tax=Liparis tanakae TaxID=230148 RepID=A0A4Z2G0L2_9TELE|nr:hypothetical protein EYF80_043108 [Liparis tanakae]
MSDLVHLLLPLSAHGGAGGVSSVGDGVEDLGGGAAGLLDLGGVPPRQHLLQAGRPKPSWIPGSTPHPLEAEYCSALFIVVSSKVSVAPLFSLMDADWKGKVLGLGAPPAKEMRDGGDRCCSSARRK